MVTLFWIRHARSEGRHEKMLWIDESTSALHLRKCHPPHYSLDVTLMSLVSTSPLFWSPRGRAQAPFPDPPKEAITPKENKIDFSKEFTGKIDRFTLHTSMSAIHSRLRQFCTTQCALEPIWVHMPSFLLTVCSSASYPNSMAELSPLYPGDNNTSCLQGSLLLVSEKHES